jgi:hypothetical protein
MTPVSFVQGDNWIAHTFQLLRAQRSRSEAARLPLESSEELPDSGIPFGLDLDRDPQTHDFSDDEEDDDWRIVKDQQPFDNNEAEDVVQRFGAGQRSQKTNQTWNLKSTHGRQMKKNKPEMQM